ncbi:sulfatase, partial [Halobacteriales archaeon QS_7_69_60]
EHIPDEAYRLDDDPGETEPVADLDPVVEGTLAALERFEARSAAEWGGAGVDADELLERMDDTAKERLQDLGYME